MPRKPSLKRLYEKHIQLILAADAAHSGALTTSCPCGEAGHPVHPHPGSDCEVKLGELFACIQDARDELTDLFPKPLDKSK